MILIVYGVSSTVHPPKHDFERTKPHEHSSERQALLESGYIKCAVVKMRLAREIDLDAYADTLIGPEMNQGVPQPSQLAGTEENSTSGSAGRGRGGWQQLRGWDPMSPKF